MKKILSLGIILIFVNIVFADQIHLKDSTILNGRVIQITKKHVEYDPQGEKAFDTVDREKVYQVRYDDGKIFQVSVDKIYLYGGKIIEGVITKVDKDNIEYNPQNSQNHATISRNKIQTIHFSDGKMIELQKQTTKAKVEEYEQVERVDGFHKSIVRIGGTFNVGTLHGAVANWEDRFFNQNLTAINTNYGVRKYKITNLFLSYCVDLDLMLPAFEFNQSLAFDFTGIKIGIRGRYGYVLGRQMLTFEDDNDYSDSEISDGRLMKYHYWAVGPTFYFIFSSRSNYFNLLLNVYCLYGRVFDGRLTAAPALRDIQVMTGYSSPSEYGTGFSGNTFRFGIGPHFSLNKWVPLTFGIGFTYSVTRMELNHPLDIYNDANTVEFLYDVGFEMSLGFHL